MSGSERGISRTGEGGGTSRHVLFSLAARYPQLLLPIDPATPGSEQYRDAVLYGKEISGALDFSFSPEDWLRSFPTCAGTAEVLYLRERADFEHALCALAWRCEKREIPASVGAATVFGLINWEKIRAHKAAWLLSGGGDWDAEFRRFTAEESNYRDTLILLGAGEYSAVPAGRVGLGRAEWLEKSLTIRCYHELTHFVCRRLFPQDVDPLRDEVLADLVGTLAAFGRCEAGLVELFLGIGDSPRADGRLAHYVGADELPRAVRDARRALDVYSARLAGREKEDLFDLVREVF